MRVPNKAEITAAAAELGVDLTRPGARARVARAVLMAEDLAEQEATGAAAQAAAPVAGAPVLLSSQHLAVPGGALVVDVTFHPHLETAASAEQLDASDTTRPPDPPEPS